MVFAAPCSVLQPYSKVPADRQGAYELDKVVCDSGYEFESSSSKIEREGAIMP